MLKNKNGFTLIELLISLNIIIFTTLILSKVVPYIRPVTSEETYAVYQFIGLLERDLVSSTDVYVSNDELNYTTLTNRNITVEQYNDMIRQRRNHTGHVVLLRHVKSFEVSGEKTITVKVETKSGELFEEKIIIYHDE